MDSFVSARSDFSFYSATSHHGISPEDLQAVLESEVWSSLFQRLGKHAAVNSSPSSYSRRISSSSVCRNLLDVRDTRLFFWSEEQNAIITAEVREAELQRITVVQPPFLYFTVRIIYLT